jgi:hypothetical protein
MNRDLEKNLVRLRKISKDLLRETLTDVDRKWLADCLWKIYEGLDPVVVLGIEAGRGQRREVISRNHDKDLAMHLVSGLQSIEFEDGISLEEAFRIAGKIYGLEPRTLKRYWNDPANAHLRSEFRDHKTYD